MELQPWRRPWKHTRTHTHTHTVREQEHWVEMIIINCQLAAVSLFILCLSASFVLLFSPRFLCILSLNFTPFHCYSDSFILKPPFLLFSLTFSRTKMAEHCSGTPIILCGFHVTEFALQKQHWSEHAVHTHVAGYRDKNIVDYVLSMCIATIITFETWSFTQFPHFSFMLCVSRAKLKLVVSCMN